MKVHLQFFSHLKDVVGASSIDAAVAEGATVSVLLEDLYLRHPKLRAWDNSILIGAGVEFVERDYVIKEGDEIAIMPPVQGG